MTSERSRAAVFDEDEEDAILPPPVMIRPEELEEDVHEVTLNHVFIFLGGLVLVGGLLIWTYFKLKKNRIRDITGNVGIIVSGVSGILREWRLLSAQEGYALSEHIEEAQIIDSDT